MKIHFSKTLIGITLATSLAVPAIAEGNRLETKYFSAEIANVRRANTGNVLVTIKFIPKINEGTNLYVYSDIKQQRDDGPCPIRDTNNQTVLIDGNGDEHTARNCLPPYVIYDGVSMWGNQPYLNGMQLHAGSESTFVYKFGLAGTSSEALEGMNITIPMRYNYCYEKAGLYNTKWSTCDQSSETLSFYNISAK